MSSAGSCNQNTHSHTHAQTHNVFSTLTAAAAATEDNHIRPWDSHGKKEDLDWGRGSEKNKCQRESNCTFHSSFSWAVTTIEPLQSALCFHVGGAGSNSNGEMAEYNFCWHFYIIAALCGGQNARSVSDSRLQERQGHVCSRASSSGLRISIMSHFSSTGFERNRVKWRVSANVLLQAFCQFTAIIRTTYGLSN